MTRNGGKKSTREADDRLTSRGLAEGLKKWRDEARQTTSAPREKAQAGARSPSPRRTPRPTKVQREEAFDEHLFRAAMEGVTRLGERGAAVARRQEQPAIRMVDEDAEALALLAELVTTGQFDISDTDEYVEGIAGGIDRGLLTRLARGDFSVQGHVDLHGLGVDAARAELERFLVDSRRQGRRCVLVVHGRGLHSKDQEPVLKPRLASWLSRGRLGRLVLAFATARPVDGGAGAVYVLLRR